MLLQYSGGGMTYVQEPTAARPRVYFLQGGSGKLVNIHEGTHPSLAGTWLAGTLSEGL